MYVDSMDAPEGAVAEMMSPWQHAEENSCLEFWYHMHGNQTSEWRKILVITAQKINKLSFSKYVGKKNYTVDY